jgi:diaminohydroxyphosphoribosylaminopyrimidine deaminase/5-amino-6-(5-phosphoribosylamino)uracil reductase
LFRAPLQLALALAEEAIGRCDPNPRVGCVIVGADGAVLGKGSTQRAGASHAEVEALVDAAARGVSVRGATVCVTLEPCCHHGRTPPCCDALVAAGVAHVIVAVQDPNPQVAGRGLQRLRAAGVEVTLLAPGDPLAVASRTLNLGFFSRMIRRRPWVRMKIAASLDGRTALDNGASQWITGEAARADGHGFRKRASAVLTGIGTVLDDDPRLDVRLVPTERQPTRIVVDSRLEIPTGARILQAPGEVVIYTAGEPSSALADKARELEQRGVTLAPCPGPGGKVDLAAMLDDLAAREVNELHIEAGHKLNGSFVRAGLVDELLVYMAPKLLGLGREMARFGPLSALEEGLALAFEDIERIGDDLRLIARPAGRADF